MSSSYAEIAKSVTIVAAPLVGGGVATYLTYEWAKSAWYRDLKKPWYTPPNWVFPPVRTALYCCMGYSSYLVWRDAARLGTDVRLPLAIYGCHVVLNWIWSLVFFNRKDYGTATAIMAAMYGSAVACIVLFRDINPTASNLLVPYLGWLTMASGLSSHIWRYNKPADAKDKRSLLGYPLASNDKQKL